MYFVQPDQPVGNLMMVVPPDGIMPPPGMGIQSVPHIIEFAVWMPVTGAGELFLKQSNGRPRNAAQLTICVGDCALAGSDRRSKPLNRTITYFTTFFLMMMRCLKRTLN